MKNQEVEVREGEGKVDKEMVVGEESGSRPRTKSKKGRRRGSTSSRRKGR